jgi:oligopeptidase B
MTEAPVTAQPVATQPVAAPPTAAQRPQQRTFHGDTVIDPYEWLRDKSDPEVIAYLEAENAYTEAMTGRLGDLRQRIFTEIKDRTQETDLSVPARKGPWWYYTRTLEGKQYAVHCRAPVAAPDDRTPPELDASEPIDGEQVLLDGNEVAQGSEFFALGTFDVSPDGSLLAYSVDLRGDERYTVRVKDLTSGELLPDEISGAYYGSAWTADNSTLFYVTVNDAWRPYRVWRHTLGTPASDDQIVHEESDEMFGVHVSSSRSERYVFIDVASKTTSEVRYLDAAAGDGEFRMVAERRHGVEYGVDHAVVDGVDRFLVLHNDGAVNFALAEAPVDDPGPHSWRPMIAGDDTTRLLGVDAFASHVVVSLRRAGLAGLRILPLGAEGFGPARDIAFEEELYSAGPAGNPEFDQPTFRFAYTSLVTPASVYDYDVATGERTLRKQQPVLGGYDPDHYRQHREWATAADGTAIPISVVRRRDVPRDGNAPVLLYGYGAYEISIDPSFVISRLPLLDRGIVFAIAHVRGGGEMGRHWYDQGKLGAKRNTFTDFIACARHLVDRSWTTPQRLVAQGGSAGGLLMGAVANLAPEAFAAIVAEVPFVDALTSILDPSLPLTVAEWEEWGDPLHDPSAYEYIKSYSPYENVEAKNYPAILAVTSLHDTRVLYVEPAKWVAKLRSVGTGDRPVLLKTEMQAGHGGPSGRYDAWRERAFTSAWVIDMLAAPYEPLPAPRKDDETS